MSSSEARIAVYQPSVQPAQPRAILGREDFRNLLLLAAGFLCVILVISPARNFPINDDWIYARSVTDLLQWRYTPPDWSQTTSLSQIAWGAFFSTLFGQSFTVLTISTLVMSAACVALFYLALRHFDISPGHSLFAAALLAFNPIFFHLSYTFLTEVTFLALMLAALLCYLRGIRGYGELWYWIGGLAASLAYLTRQFGLLIVVAALVCIFFSGQLRWRRGLSIALLPILTIVVYTLWEKTQPVQLVTFVVQTVTEGLVEDPLAYIQGRLLRITWTVVPLGIYLLPIMRLPKRPALTLLFFAPLVYFLLRTGQVYGTLFPVNGNMVDHTGFEMGYYIAETVWSQAVWAIIAIVGALALSIYLAMCLEQGWAWLKSAIGSRRNRIIDPALMFHSLGLMLTFTVLFVTPSLYDRYWLPVLPFLFLPGVRQSMTTSTKNAGSISLWRWLLLAVIGLFSLVAQRDYIEHAGARWQGAEQLVAQGALHNQVDAGFEWQGWYLFEEGARRLREKPLAKYIPFPPSVVLDRLYIVNDLPVASYIQVGSLPYRSWLNGGQERHVLLLKRTP